MKLKSISGFAFGTIGSAFFGVITIPLLAWHISIEDIARFSVYQLVSGLGVLLVSMGLDQAFARYYNEGVSKNQLLLGCFSPGLLAGLMFIIFIVVFNLSNPLSEYIYSESEAKYFLITTMSVFLMYLLRVSSILLRMSGQGWGYSINQIIPKAVFCGLLLIFSFKGGGLTFFDVAVLSALSLMAVVPQFFLILKKFILENRSASCPRLPAADIYRFGLPLLLSSLIYWAVTAVGTIVLKSTVGLHELGLYAVVMNLAGVAVIFQNLLAVVWIPVVYKWVADQEDFSKIDNALNYVVMFVVVFMSFLGIFSGIIDVFLPEDYFAIKYMIMCAVLQPFFYAISEVSGIGIAIVKRTYLTLFGSAATFIICWTLAYYLVPVYGAKGAVLSNAVAFFIFFIFRTELSVKYWRAFPRIRMYVAALSCLILSVLSMFLDQIFYVATIWCVFLIFSCFWFRVQIAAVFLLLFGGKIN